MKQATYSLSPRTVRGLVAATCTVCVAGMIVSAALRHLGGVLAFGCLSTGAIVTLISVIASASAIGAPAAIDARGAHRVERLVEQLVVEGANEATARELVGAALTLEQTPTRGVS
jgi:hypothetical protein